MNMRFTRRIIAITLLSMPAFFAQGVSAAEQAAGPSLYERLGGDEGLTEIVRGTIALHHKNHDIAQYFVDIDDDVLAGHVIAFFAAGTGGPANYQGRDMTTAHATLNLSDAEFDSAVADVLTSVKAYGVDAESVAEVAAILESLRASVLGTAES